MKSVYHTGCIGRPCDAPEITTVIGNGVSIMTNEERLKSYSRKRFAELLILVVQEPDYDEGIDGEWYECGENTYYVTSDGKRFWDDYESALQHECWWLAQEYNQDEGGFFNEKRGVEFSF